MSFKDVPSNHWAKDHIEKAASLKLVNGYPDDTFRPENTLSRAEAAAIAMRLYDRTEDSFEDVLAEVDPAIVQIETDSSIGSGTSIGRGFVLTNAHVVGNHRQVGIRWDAWGYGEKGNAQYAEGPVVFSAPEIDLAVVRVDIAEHRRMMPKLPLGRPEDMRRGMPVLVAGSPLGLIGSVSAGIVSYVGRHFTYKQANGNTVVIPDAVQVDAAINPGNSGGALVNLRGELVGVPSVKLAGEAIEGLGFAVGLETVRTAIRRAEETGALATAFRTDLMAAFRDQGLTIA